MTMDAPRRDSAERRLATLFPTVGVQPAPRPWYRRTSVVVAVAVAVVLSVGLVATQAFGGSGDSYRTADASMEDVDAVQTGVATIEPVAQATVAFPVSGSVATVNVQVGDHVDAGGTLASLDTTALARALHEKQAALAQAQLTLDKGMSGQPISLGPGGSGGGGASGGGSGSAATSGGASSASSAAYRSGNDPRLVLAATTDDPALVAARQAVVTAQQHVDAALADAATALTSESSVCAPFTTSPTTTTTTPGSSSPDVTACQQAITAVSNAQSAVSAAQQALAAAAGNLDALLATTSPPSSSPASPPDRGPATPSSPATGSTGGGGGSASGGASRSGSSGGSSGGASGGGFGSSSGPSAADLVAAQRNVDAATMAVLAAQQSMDQATIASPLAGTVVAVDMKVGDAVSAASSTEDIVVEGTGGYEVSTAVGVDQIPSIAVGQPATVVPDGGHRQLTGKVVAISIAPSSTSTYRVVIGLTHPDARLQDGATGTVDVVTHRARSALAVPTSAIVTVRNRHFVQVLRGGTETLTPVQVGVVGATWTEIRPGISRGTPVVLADASAPLPGSATSSPTGTQSTTPFGGFGRLFGGGAGGGARGARGG
jgi:HlyD family secretion protein